MNIVCKICEEEVEADLLIHHSSICKEVKKTEHRLVELKDQLIKEGERANEILNLITKNAALQKKEKEKEKKKKFLGRTNTYNTSHDAPTLSTPILNTSQKLAFPTLAGHTVHESINEKAGLDPNDPKDSLAYAIMQATAKAEVKQLSDNDYKKLMDEFSKSSSALKIVTDYAGKLNSPSYNLLAVNDRKSNDLQAKNELDLYNDISDETVAEFLKTFMETLQELMGNKTKHSKKAEELKAFKQDGDSKKDKFKNNKSITFVKKRGSGTSLKGMAEAASQATKSSEVNKDGNDSQNETENEKTNGENSPSIMSSFFKKPKFSQMKPPGMGDESDKSDDSRNSSAVNSPSNKAIPAKKSIWGAKKSGGFSQATDSKSDKETESGNDKSPDNSSNTGSSKKSSFFKREASNNKSEESEDKSEETKIEKDENKMIKETYFAEKLRKTTTNLDSKVENMNSSTRSNGMSDSGLRADDEWSPEKIRNEEEISEELSHKMDYSPKITPDPHGREHIRNSPALNKIQTYMMPKRDGELNHQIPADTKVIKTIPLAFLAKEEDKKNDSDTENTPKNDGQNTPSGRKAGAGADSPKSALKNPAKRNDKKRVSFFMPEEQQLEFAPKLQNYFEEKKQQDQISDNEPDTPKSNNNPSSLSEMDSIRSPQVTSETGFDYVVPAPTMANAGSMELDEKKIQTKKSFKKENSFAEGEGFERKSNRIATTKIDSSRDLFANRKQLEDKLNMLKNAKNPEKRIQALKSLRESDSLQRRDSIVKIEEHKSDDDNDSDYYDEEPQPRGRLQRKMSKRNSKLFEGWETPPMRESKSCEPFRTIKLEDSPIIDFEFIKFLGKGAYGTVWLVRKKPIGDLYAMKLVEWKNRHAQSNLNSIKAEKDIFERLEGDYVLNAIWTFHYENYICFVMEYMKGGDFKDLLEKYCCLEEHVAKFYFAELVLAVESIHKLGIVHRDLKPDNILIDPRGHIKLTDFGLSDLNIEQIKNQGVTAEESDDKEFQLFSKFMTNKQIEEKKQVGFKPNDGKQSIFNLPPSMGKKSSMKASINIETKDKTTPKEKKVRIVGTPDYIAPEIIKGLDCSHKAVDWWSMGVILYELLCGVAPFNDETIEAVFDNIVNKRMEWPSVGDEDGITQEAYNLMDSLLSLDPEKRLGYNGAHEVKQHPFFKGIDWENLREAQPPMVPYEEDDYKNTKAENPFAKQERHSLRVTAEQEEQLESMKMSRLDILDKYNRELYKEMMKKKNSNPGQLEEST